MVHVFVIVIMYRFFGFKKKNIFLVLPVIKDISKEHFDLMPKYII